MLFALRLTTTRSIATVYTLIGSQSNFQNTKKETKRRATKCCRWNWDEEDVSPNSDETAELQANLLPLEYTEKERKTNCWSLHPSEKKDNETKSRPSRNLGIVSYDRRQCLTFGEISVNALWERIAADAS